jgi:ABC-2 type transport system permease protein
MSGLRTMVHRQLRVNRTCWLVMASLMAIFNVVQLQGYQSVFPNPQTRDALLSTFANSNALRIFCGYPFDISNATGWMAWRNMSTIGMAMALWAAFVTVGGLRGEEEASSPTGC